MVNWKKSENEKGFIYYINEETEIHQWDHPKFGDIKQAIDDCNYVSYASYRLALKLRVLQQSLYLDEVALATIISIFQNHGLANSENSIVLETYDLEAVLTDIFYVTNKQNHTNTDIDFATEVIINFLYNVFDSHREGKVQVLATKVTLGLLCNFTHLEDLHKYLFLLCADHNNCMTRTRFRSLLLKIQMIIKYLHEDTYFETKSLNLAVEKCFANSPGLVGITENNFISWLELDDVPFLSWIPLVPKLKSSETTIHNLKCTTCKSRPILGLKYRCTKCSQYTQCQRCFFTGRISHSHKLTHSLREYSCPSSSSKIPTTNRYFQKIYDFFHQKGKLQSTYRIVKPSRQFSKENCITYLLDPLGCNVEPLSSPEAQLQGVIRQLESQNRELQQMLIFGTHSDKQMRKYLEEYRLFMAGNIQKLKTLKNQINSPCDEHTETAFVNNLKVQSTPGPRNEKTRLNISPITVMTELSDTCKTPPVDKSLDPNKKNTVANSPVKVLHNDLDEALARLQQILANNFSLEDSMNHLNNTNLKFAVNEVEGMLTSIIDNVESSRCNSALASNMFQF